MFEKLNKMNFETAEAHCDGPCGVYDPAQARIEAESVLQLTKKILDLKRPEGDDAKAHLAFHNTLTRFIAIKEERAELAKHHLLVLWTDYFKQAHLEKYPDLHEIFWKAAKASSSFPLRRTSAAYSNWASAADLVKRYLKTTSL